jgi:uncharacterized protein (DUF1800 family)
MRVALVVAFSLVALGDTRADELSPDEQVAHVLDRLGFGARPGERERVRKLGVAAYIEEQLHPEQLDDHESEQRLAGLRTLTLDTPTLTAAYWESVRNFVDSQMAKGNAAEMKLRYGIEGGATPAPAASGKIDRTSLRSLGELQRSKVMRAIFSRRQLVEVLVDFWSNHFNIDVKKGLCRPLKPEDDRVVVRPHVLGRFRDLLGASAHSAAMMFYLDNAENSVARDISPEEQKIRQAYRQKIIGDRVRNDALSMSRVGPNENYGRELLELHTLGVDGGYTQKDVQEVARAFSGWALDPLSGAFRFLAVAHDDGEKHILGHTLPAHGGAGDGERVLDLLATHPATAHFVSKKLCQRFVSDEPPAALVDQVAKVFLDSGGDLRKVTGAILRSPQFMSRVAYRAKVKSPFELAVSAVRATGAAWTPPAAYPAAVEAVREGAAVLGYGADALNADSRKSLNWRIAMLGEPLFSYAAPTGYPELSSKWVSPGALIERLDFAVALTGGLVNDLHVEPRELVGNIDLDHPDALIDKLSTALLGGPPSAATRAVLRKSTPDGSVVDPARLLALLIGSPEFQRR